MTFTSPISLFFAVLIAIGLFVLAWMRRPALPRASIALAAVGVMALTLATGGISCRSGREPRVAVMVDCSPSTRGAIFRDTRWLRSRVRDLVGTRRYDLYAFADVSRKLGETDSFSEMPADLTNFIPPANADAIVLFSDGRFDLPAASAPVTAVVDPTLANPTDASIVNLEERGNELAAEVRNTGNPRTLSWVNRNRQSTTAPAGSTVVTTRLVTTTETITARLSPGDAWPENDALAIRPSPPIASQRWWVGDAPPRGWMSIAPENLPLEGSAWLGPAIVVLSNVPADAISPQQQDRLEQYVRDLGGALVILGGDRAFAAGHYVGSDLEALSPLSSAAPEPVTHWIMLVDSSGSMSAEVHRGPAGTGTRFTVASDALVSVLHELPKADLVSIGSFARELRWWSIARKALDTSLMKLPPSDVIPNGPTNLEAALQQIVASQPASPPIELLVLSDAEAQFTDATALAAQLREHHVRLHALVIGNASADSTLAPLVQSTGGQLATEADPAKWVSTVRRMLRAVMPEQIIRNPVTVRFGGGLSSLPSRTAPQMNRTWLKQSATALATASNGSDTLPAAARWSAGSGDVLAMAFTPNADEIGAIEQTIARRPRDPRFTVTWHAGATLHLRIDAHDNRGYLNDQHLSVESSGASRTPIPQTAPGTYETDFPAPRSPATITLLHDAQVLDRFAIAGRYPREFEAIGNDMDNLRALVERSGGRIIDAQQPGLLDFPDTRQARSLAAIFSALGALLFAGALVVWRLVPSRT